MLSIYIYTHMFVYKCVYIFLPYLKTYLFFAEWNCERSFLFRPPVRSMTSGELGVGHSQGGRWSSENFPLCLWVFSSGLYRYKLYYCCLCSVCFLLLFAFFNLKWNNPAFCWEAVSKWWIIEQPQMFATFLEPPFWSSSQQVLHSGKLTHGKGIWTLIEDVYFPLNIGIFQPAMLIYWRVVGNVGNCQKAARHTKRASIASEDAWGQAKFGEAWVAFKDFWKFYPDPCPTSTLGDFHGKCR